MLCSHGVLELGVAGPIRSYSYLVVQIIFTGDRVRSLETFVWPGHPREFKIGDLWMAASYTHMLWWGLFICVASE